MTSLITFHLIFFLILIITISQSIYQSVTMIRIKQTAHKLTEKVSRKNQIVKANNSDKNKVKIFKRNLSKKCKIKSKDIYELFIYYDLLISVIIKALQEIHYYQKLTKLLILKLFFQHMIREICAEMLRENLK